MKTRMTKSTAMTMLTADDLNAIEAGIDDMSYSGATVQRLVDEIRQYKAKADISICAWCGQECPKESGAIAEHVLACEKRPEKKLAEEIIKLGEALSYLDAIIAAYEADDRGSLVVACELAKQWRILPEDNHD